MHTTRFDITGMTCSACSSRVHKAVAALPGVSEANVNLLKNSLSVQFDRDMIGERDIMAAIEKAGYGAVPHARPDGHGSASSAAARGPGVGSGGQNALPSGLDAELAEMRRRLRISLVFTVPLFILSMGHMVGLPLPAALSGPENALALGLTQFLLTLPVVAVNARYYRVGFKTLLAGAPNMDSLIAIGSGAAVTFGVYALYRMAHALGQGDLNAAHGLIMNLYFESAAMILTLITLGKYFEARAKGKTSEAIGKLLDLAPKTATVLREGREQTVPRESVQSGDILVVRAGESVPVDGVITEGSGYLDESAISGESLPVEKQAGDAVTGATINTAGHFLFRATRVGEDTTLAQIVRLVDEATSSKAPIARLADRISGIFVPVVILIAVAATLVWLLLGHDLAFALSIGISVLVISCPCALGLATPTAIMVGTGRGAASGILLKSAEAIETAQAVDTVVLDKTGTVTEGRPVLTDVLTAADPARGSLASPGRSGEGSAAQGGAGESVTPEEDALFRVALALEKRSEHPLALAIVAEAEARGYTAAPVADFRQVPGQGVVGDLDGQRSFAGNERMVLAEGLELDPVLRRAATSLASEGKTVLYFGQGPALLGILAVADVIKPTSPQAVAALEGMGVEVIMLTGDNARTAEAVRRQAGIREVLAEVLPADKERVIRDLQAKGRRVAMIGDGINDAPALARADVGIAIGAGTDIAIEAADIVLIRSDLRDAATAIQLSRAVMRTIRQNLFWAFFYNALGIPVAAGVFYGLWRLTLSPMIAAAAMSLSSVSVVSNALRLRFFTASSVKGGADIDSRSMPGAAVEPQPEASPLSPLHDPEAAQPRVRAPLEQPGNPQAPSAFFNPTPDVARATPDQPKRNGMKKVLHIEGMSCGHCTGSVEKALKALPGVSAVSVDLTTKTASVETDGNVPEQVLREAVTGLGFTVTSVQ